jgi:hypothetical protein
MNIILNFVVLTQEHKITLFEGDAVTQECTGPACTWPYLLCAYNAQQHGTVTTAQPSNDTSTNLTRLLTNLSLTQM